MYLDYSKLEFDADGRPEVPELVLKTLGGDVIGVVPGVMNLRLNIKFSEPSEISFDVPAVIDDKPNPMYSLITGHKLIYTKHYGIYKIMNPTETGDGISEVKNVSGYSLEKTLESKKFFLEEGTFNFWNPASPKDTVIGRILEIAKDWSVGYVSPALIGCYRTFDSYDDYLLSFVYNDAPEKYRCVFVFDPYQMTINVYDADEEQPVLPIYLDYDNLVNSIEIEELSDELVTAIRPYGADELNIMDVNPIGSNWIYDLSYFISNGDIPAPLAKKWEDWQHSILAMRSRFEGLMGLRSSADARILTEEAALVDLKGELDGLKGQQNVTIQAIALEAGGNGYVDVISTSKDAIKARVAGLDIKYNKSDRKCKWYLYRIGATSRGPIRGSMDLPARVSHSDSIRFDSLEAGVSYIVEAVISAPNLDDIVMVAGATILSDDDVNVAEAAYAGRTGKAASGDETDGKKSPQQELLDEINAKIKATEKKIADKEALIASIHEESDSDSPTSYQSQINEIVDRLAIEKYFTNDELNFLSRYFIEQDLTEETFVASDLDPSISGTSYSLTDEGILVENASITRVHFYGSAGDFIQGEKPTMYVINGGTLTISGTKNIQADIIRGTMEVRNIESSRREFILSIYAGKITAGDASAPSGTITISGASKHLFQNIHQIVEDGVTFYRGTRLLIMEGRLIPDTTSMFMTANVSEYEKYSVQMELYDYAAGVLGDLAVPTYEFSVDSGNFLFASEFKPFRDKLALGSGVYLNIGSQKLITPLIIEFELDFEDFSKFSLVFSNRFKRHDNVNTIKNMIESSYSSSRSFDSSKYVYGQSVAQASKVSQFMSGSLNAAVNTVIGAENQSVIIDGAGIHVGGNSKYQIRIVDSMIAMTDDGWQTSKMALGRFASPETGEYWGVNCEVLGGKLIVGNNLIIENVSDTGVKQFRVDSTGAWLNNSTFVLQSDNGGKILLDPKYGIVAGTGSLYSTDGTTVSPSFIDENGKIILDDDKMPANSNFFLDIRDGNAYFRGTIKSGAGSIGGWQLADNELHSGKNSTFVALNSSPEDDSLYAIWAGSETPNNAKFWVKRDGTMHARDGEFTGTIDAARIKAATLDGDLVGGSNGGAIKGVSLDIGDGNFLVDSGGNVTIKNGSISWGAVTGTDEIDQRIQAAQNSANTAQTKANAAELIAKEIADGEYAHGTFIKNNKIFSPTIYADEFVVKPANEARPGKWTGGYKLFGYEGDRLLPMFNISYRSSPMDAPLVVIGSPCGAYARWDFGRTYFYGSCDFSTADEVVGITATFG